MLTAMSLCYSLALTLSQVLETVFEGKNLGLPFPKPGHVKGAHAAGHIREDEPS
jgi:hypothetical protein